MAQRYIRVRTSDGQTFYGLLQPDRSVQLLDGPPWQHGKLTKKELKPDSYQLLAPCEPSKIIGVGRNYRDHAIELGNAIPTQPMLFLKPPTTIIHHGGNIRYPQQSTQVDYEGELALIIGETCVNCPPEKANSKIWGYTIANDVTARDLQKQDGQWTRAKGFDTFCPLGPWIIRQLSPVARLQTFINDDTKPAQSSSISQMVFPPDFLISYISQVMTLLPGDVILTGTPQGVGPLKPGDQIRVEIEGIGFLENSVIS